MYRHATCEQLLYPNIDWFRIAVGLSQRERGEHFVLFFVLPRHDRGPSDPSTFPFHQFPFSRKIMENDMDRETNGIRRE